MPVLVVGADTPVGQEIVTELLDREGDVRTFVSDPAAGESFKQRGAKVAVGDPSDDSHIEGAATQAFSAVMITGCLRDGRELSFAESPDAVMDRWAQALRSAKVRRVIWVLDPETTLDSSWAAATPEHSVLHEGERSAAALAKEVALLDEATSL
ncbi:MAG: NAD(P)H-binding protein [Acidimicrobiia bacterium]